MARKWQKILIIIGVILAGSLKSAPVNAGVNDFEFKELYVEYKLSKDAEGRSKLEVSESFVAVFPNFNQNRGIIRSIPTEYQGHSLNLKLDSVYRNGRPAPIYKDEKKSGFRELTIRDSSSNSFLHGENEYEFNYTMQDVILKPNNADLLEFYWDTNGTGWKQPFGSVKAKVIIDKSIAQEVLGDKIACYTGSYGGNSSKCNSHYEKSESVFYFWTTEELRGGENMSLTIAFKPGTFTLYRAGPGEIALFGLGILLSLSVVPLTIVAVRMIMKARKTQKLDVVPVEYIPPRELDIFYSILLYGGLSKISKFLPAGLIDLAVNHKIKITEKRQKKTLGLAGEKKYMIEPIVELENNQRRFFHAVFNQKAEIGRFYEIKKRDLGLGPRIQAMSITLMQELEKKGLIDGDLVKKTKIKVCMVGILATSIAIISFCITENFHSNDFYQYLPEFYSSVKNFIYTLWIINWLSSVVAVIAMAGALTFRGFTEEGKLTMMKLKGLEKYIKLSETERLAFNQSAKTALRVKERIVLYERILPYAMLFGLEKSWNKTLGKYYEEASCQPDWYFGAVAFSASQFSVSMNSFSSKASSAFSSGSSGSSGGGFSGGGGGGGGGGGC